VNIEVSDLEQIWSSTAVIKIIQKKSNILVKIRFYDKQSSRMPYRQDETMQWREYPCSSTVSISRTVKRAMRTVGLVLEPTRGGKGECNQPISHYWQVHVLIIFERLTQMTFVFLEDSALSK